MIDDVIEAKAKEGVLFEDTTGQGHRSRTTNNQVRKTIFVTLD